ncbi:hypothetical protein LTR08_005009 [Meristemomyces frigidus]|nr:hypothetical protein LTR08_005009 [Meristemomyces frigidus]
MSSSARRLQEEKVEHKDIIKEPSIPPTLVTPKPETPPPPAPPIQTAAVLPSDAEKQRSQLSRETSRIVDRLLARASIAGQHINAYTGTDYSGIETLRTEILDQEREVKTRHTAVTTAQESHHGAYVKQASAQKEIVSLLERKSSWSPTDLERYMTLVRSEHLNDQAVQAAKDSLAAAERELEDSRALLERHERKQYHEEQIWSDTIRRNSTWVTFGLMGFNIILLLAQILFFEPYRRRKIVREVKVALDERTLGVPVGSVETLAAGPVEAVEEAPPVAQVPAEAPLLSTEPLEAVLSETEDAGVTPLAAGKVLPEEAAVVSEAAAPVEHQVLLPPWPEVPAHSWEAYKATFHDLFSERLIQIKQVELTTVALQGAATGVAVMGLLFVLLRPK